MIDLVIKAISKIDINLFLSINSLPHNFFTDHFFFFFSGVGKISFVWIGIMTILFVWEELKDKKVFFTLIAALFFSFLFSEIILKNIIKRPRPQFVMERIILVEDNQKNYSFPSSHATLAFAAAYVLAKEHKKWQKGYFLLAFLIAFSRVYLGKHYPLDVIMGAFLGIFIGHFSLLAIEKIVKK